MIRVCIADDQALMRSGLCALLALFDGIEVIAEACDGLEAIACVADRAPDVLLLDIRMPRMGGVEVVKELALRRCLPATLLLTTFDDDSALVAGIRAGARGFLLKGVTAETLVEAIRAVAAGGTYLYAPLAAAFEHQFEAAWQDQVPIRTEMLTGREREILKLMTSGISNKEIASALNLGEGTVRNHVSSILSKLGVSDRTRAVLHAIEQKMV